MQAGGICLNFHNISFDLRNINDLKIMTKNAMSKKP